MNIARLFTSSSELVANTIHWKKVPVRIEEGGKVILDLQEVEVPAHWSQSAAQILAHKYFRKSGVPSATALTGDNFFAPSVPTDDATYGGETSAKQVFHRLAGHWTYMGQDAGYFEDKVQARRFYDEIYYMLAMQMAAPNSPQWFNTGLWWAYGITGNNNGCYTSDGIGQAAYETKDTYTYPQTSACFILGLKDSLLGESGILQTVEREGRIFKFGSGSGVNYSGLRGKGKPLSNGGTSSGMMSFLKLFDINAGTIKSGGTTRRAARMVIVDADHPEAEAFVEWKAREEVKVAAMVAGANATSTEKAPSFVQEVSESLKRAEYEGEAYSTVSGQNANNSLRVTDSFMQSVQVRHTPDTDVLVKRARLWKKTCEAAWMCGDPGLQFHDTINKWHTIPKVAPQRATNPCSEYSFIDDSSCNLASMNLMSFINNNGNFDYAAFKHACRLWTIVLDISVGMSSYPDKKVAENSIDYRAIGLGYANLGGLLMSKGVPYDSEEGRAIAGLITACMHGFAWQTSCDLADTLGSFKDFSVHADDVSRVRMLHRSAAMGLLNAPAVQTILGEPKKFAWIKELVSVTNTLWEDPAYLQGHMRNAQLTLLAPTGTIGLVMDCATTGIEPDFSLVKHKKLAGGGTMTLTNECVGRALAQLGYGKEEAAEILTYVRTTGCVDIHCAAIRKSDIPVFACANEISAAGHIRMMAAVQPFLSGAISKTVNLPNSATVGDISSAYTLAWEKGIKAIAIYRDGCKLSQPLTAITSKLSPDQGPKRAPDDVSGIKLPSAIDANLGKYAAGRVSGARKLSPRYKMPSRRNGFTQKVKIANQSLYLRTGEYSDGKLGEIFLTFGRDGTTMSHLMDSIAILMSLGLQHGVPLQEFVDAFTSSRAEPSGMVVNSENVKFCSSIMDYVVRELSAEYLAKEEGLDPVVAVEPTAPALAETATDEEPVIIDPEMDAPMLVTAPVTLEEITRNLGSTSLPPKPTLTLVGGKEDVTSGVKKVDGLTPGIRTMVAATFRGSTSPAAISAALSTPRYDGSSCGSCGSFTMRRAGSCHVCDTCGETSGCS